MTSGDKHSTGADLMVQVGARIRFARGRAALTQQEVATAAGMTQRHLSSVESGGQDVGLRTLARLSLVLGVPLGELLADLDLAAVALESRRYSKAGRDG